MVVFCIVPHLVRYRTYDKKKSIYSGWAYNRGTISIRTFACTVQVHLRILMRPLWPSRRSSMNPPAQAYKNRALAALPKAEINRLRPHLSLVPLPQNQTLADGSIKDCYFLEDGLASVVQSVQNGDTVEVGIIGIDGVVGLPRLLGAKTQPGRTFIQVAGSGYRIDADILAREFERSGELRNYLQKYLQGFIVQTSQTAVCNRLHNIEERLARWLLTCRDRMETDRLQLTHDFLGQMLGAPRTTVTLAAGLLHRAGLIDYSRGVVTIKNRTTLADASCECYAVVRNEFRRLGLL